MGGKSANGGCDKKAKEPSACWTAKAEEIGGRKSGLSTNEGDHLNTDGFTRDATDEKGEDGGVGWSAAERCSMGLEL